MAHVGDLQLTLDVLVDLFLGCLLLVVYLLQLCLLEFPDIVQESFEVVLCHVVNRVVPVVLLGVLGTQSPRVHTSEVAHEDVKALLGCFVGQALMSPVHNPSLGIVQDSMLEIDSFERGGFLYPLHGDYIAVLGLLVRLAPTSTSNYWN